MSEDWVTIFVIAEKENYLAISDNIICNLKKMLQLIIEKEAEKKGYDDYFEFFQTDYRCENFDNMPSIIGNDFKSLNIKFKMYGENHFIQHIQTFPHLDNPYKYKEKPIYDEKLVFSIEHNEHSVMILEAMKKALSEFGDVYFRLSFKDEFSKIEIDEAFKKIHIRKFKNLVRKDFKNFNGKFKETMLEKLNNFSSHFIDVLRYEVGFDKSMYQTKENWYKLFEEFLNV